MLWCVRPVFAMLSAFVLLVAGLTYSTSTSAAAAQRDGIRVSIANIEGEDKPRLGRLLSKRKPHVLVVSEAKRARKHLKGLADRKGYRLRQYTRKRGAEAPGIALLIRDGVKIKKRTLLRMDEPWYWSTPSKRHAPRRYPAVDLRVSGQRWLVLGVHFPPGGPKGGHKVDFKNRPAWHESKRAVRRYAARHPNPPVLAVGDLNAYAPECRRHFPGFKVTRGGQVDHAMAKKGRGVRIQWVNRDKPDTGHGWVTFKFTAA